MIGRSIPHAHTLEGAELYATSSNATVLQDVTMAEMNGLLRQIAALGSCAADIFEGVRPTCVHMTTNIHSHVFMTSLARSPFLQKSDCISQTNEIGIVLPSTVQSTTLS